MSQLAQRHQWRFPLRWLLAIVWLAALAAIGGLGYQIWRVNQPRYLWQRAQQALAAGDLETARLELHNVVNRDPTHAAAHLALAEIYRQRAQSPDRAVSRGDQGRWLVHLAAAADARRGDLVLQKRLVRVLLDHHRMREAAAIAERVVALDGKDAEARYLVAWRAVARHNIKAAGEQLAALDRLSPQPTFRALALQAKLAEDVHDSARMDRVLTTAVDTAAARSGDELSALSAEQQRAMEGLLLAAIQRATDDATAKARGLKLLDVLEKWTASGDQPRLQSAARLACQVGLRLAEQMPRRSTADASAQTPSWFSRIEALVKRSTDHGLATAETVRDLAVLRLRLGQLQHAKTLLRRALEDGGLPDSTDDVERLPLERLLAEQLLSESKLDECRRHAEVLVEHDSTAGHGHLILGRIEMAEGRFDKALDHFLAAKRRLGATLPLRVALAHTCLTLGQWRQALSYLETLHADADAAASAPSWPRSRLKIDDLRLHRAQAFAYLAAGDWSGARQHLAALKGTRYDADQKEMIFRFLWTHGRRSEALRQVEAACARYPDHLRLWRDHAVALALAGRREEADERIRLFAAAHGGDVAARMLQVQWAIAARRYDEALRLLDLTQRRFPDHDEPRLAKAQLLLALGQEDQAVAAASSIHEDSPLAPAATLVAVDAEIQQGHIAAAAKRFERLSADGWRGLGRGEIAAANRDWDAAVEAFADTLDFSRLNHVARLGLLDALDRHEAAAGPASSAKLVSRLLEKHPDDAALLLAASQLALRQQDPGLALKVLNRFEAVAGASAATALLKAQALRAAGQIDEALAVLELGLGREPEHVASRILAAQLALERRDYQKALTHSTVAAKLTPEGEKAQLVRAEALYQLGDREAAEEQLRELIDRHPHQAAAFGMLARLYQRQRNPGEALSVIEQGRRNQPRDVNLIREEIRLLAQVNRVAEATQRAERIGRTDPRFEVALAMATAFYDARHLPGAERWGRRALELAAEDRQWTAHWLLGNVALAEYRQTFDVQRARDARHHYEKVLSDRPTHLAAGNNLAWLLIEALDDPQAALDVAEQVRDHRPASELPVAFVDTLATIYRRTGRLDKARRLLEGVASADGGSPLVQYQLGLLYLARQQPREARRALLRALRGGLDGSAADEARQQLQSLGTATPQS